jgi:hypothetical protein
MSLDFMLYQCRPEDGGRPESSNTAVEEGLGAMEVTRPEKVKRGGVVREGWV